jgi:hypothetical protein
MDMAGLRPRRVRGRGGCGKESIALDASLCPYLLGGVVLYSLLLLTVGFAPFDRLAHGGGPHP